MGHDPFVPEELQDYVLDHWLREPEILRLLLRETASHSRAGMQIAPDQGQLMQLVARVTGARRFPKIGGFAG